MLVIIGLVIVFGCVAGGYLAHGGHLDVLWQPFEFVIIFGAALGAFIMSSSKTVLMGCLKSFGPLLKGPKYKKRNYMELLSCLYAVFKLAKSKGDLALEMHVDNPHESSIFQEYPTFLKDHHALEFTCDYLRLLTLGSSNPHELEAVMDVELEAHHNDDHDIAGAIQTVADGLPALGIVAAVLGVIHTMGSITEPPEILGQLIGAALVGTFSGILGSYGMVAPIAKSLQTTFEANAAYLQCIKTGLIAHIQGYAPQVSIEFARKTLPSDVRPSFAEIDDLIQNVKT